MQDFRRFLVGLDGSEASRQALREVLKLPEAVITAVAVAPCWPGEAAAGRGEAPRYCWQEPAAAVLEEAREWGGRIGVPIDTRLTEGEPYERLVALAREEGADAIVVGLKGQNLPASSLMGSTTARVIGLSPVDVLVVPEGARLEFATVLLPTDGSRFSRQAASRALSLCQAAPATLAVVMALDLPPALHEVAPGVARRLCREAEVETAGICRQADALQVACERFIRPGSAHRVVLEVAREVRASLIVLGSHGRTGLKRLLMGSVAERVLGSSPCPVLVVKKRP